jgi:hypothetical protein
MDQHSSFNRRYFELTLGIERHFPGYVDAYIGPPEVRAAVEGAPVRSVEELEGDLRWLDAYVPDAEPRRERYLRATLRAIGGTLRLLRGEELDYLDEVAVLYDIEPQPVDEAVFLEAHAVLDELLPGDGELPARMEAWRAYYELPEEKVLPLAELARAATRERTAGFVALAPGEGLEVRLTENQPWSAYNWYLGNGRSLIEFNTDLPVNALFILGIFAHEGYPGHHTEAQLKERLLWQERGYGEQAVALLASPAAVIAEGIATTAVEMVFPGETAQAWVQEVLLPAAGIEPRETAAERTAIEKATKALRYTSGNAAYLYHTGKLDREATIEYLMTYALSTRRRAEQSFDFVSNRLYRGYIFTYTEGYDLLERAGTDDKPGLFKRLLTEQVLPSELKGQDTRYRLQGASDEEGV